eukprot:3398664-Prymnesium_polylepis.1
MWHGGHVARRPCGTAAVCAAAVCAAAHLRRVAAALHIRRGESALPAERGVEHHVAAAVHEVDHEALP